MLPLGTAAPDFALPDVTTGEVVRLGDFLIEQPLVVMFICRHCPFVQHVKTELAQLARDYAGRVGFVAINPNDPTDYPDDAPARLREMAAAEGFTFPFLFDESQAVARAYHAACTPDFFVFDTSRRLAYRGQLDDSRPGNGVPVTGRDLRAALDALLAGHAVSADQRPSIGCSIKWKAA
jgi:peroxiredoxin